jgi:hypothetical protein
MIGLMDSEKLQFFLNYKNIYDSSPVLHYIWQ